jgi:hypothetical protein
MYCQGAPNYSATRTAPLSELSDIVVIDCIKPLYNP